MRSILTALAIGAFVLAVPPAAAPAQAASETRARVDTTECFPIENGHTACLTTKGATNETTTPSGNVAYQYKVTITFTIKDPTGRVVSQSPIELHFQSLVQDGVIRAQGDHVSYTLPLNGQTCTFQSDVQYTNGVIRYSHFQYGCS